MSCGNLIPRLHVPCGDQGEFCSESCYHAELIRDIWILCERSGELGPLTTTYNIGLIIDALRGKLNFDFDNEIEAQYIPSITHYMWGRPVRDALARNWSNQPNIELVPSIPERNRT